MIFLRHLHGVGAGRNAGNGVGGGISLYGGVVYRRRGAALKQLHRHRVGGGAKALHRAGNRADGCPCPSESINKFSAECDIAATDAFGIAQRDGQGADVLLVYKRRSERPAVSGAIHSCRTASVFQQSGDRIRLKGRQSAAVHNEIVGSLAAANGQGVSRLIDRVILPNRRRGFIEIRIEKIVALIIPRDIHMIIFSVDADRIPRVSLG